MASDLDRVVPLDELDDFQVAEGDPDIRGWDVISADGRRVGEVDELLVDTVARKVRYLDVGIDEELLGAPNDERHILIPIGYARLDRDHDRVLVDTLNSADLVGMPEYTHAPLTRDYETTLRQHLEPGYAAPAEGEFYHGVAYDDQGLYGPRRPMRSTAPIVEEELDTPLQRQVAGEVEIGRAADTHHLHSETPSVHGDPHGHRGESLREQGAPRGPQADPPRMYGGPREYTGESPRGMSASGYDWRERDRLLDYVRRGRGEL